MALDRRFVVNLQGTDFVTYNGLMDMAHQMGLQSIKTELIQIPTEENGNRCIVKATVTALLNDAPNKADRTVITYEGYGDADPSNVNRMIAKHSIRMAETRAKARALRDLTNVGMTALDEVDMEDFKEDKKPVATSKPITTNKKEPSNKNASNSLTCTDCNIPITEAAKTYSVKTYGKPLCMNCQKKNEVLK